jgi:hypothetical protein
MWQIPKLQVHVAHACNLACDNCSHYSNFGHKGILSLETVDGWLSQWSPRLQPMTFCLLGGEPTINPQLVEFIRMSRRHFPRSRLQLTTNGSFLDRHPDLPKVMQEVGNIHMDVSIHHGSWQWGTLIGPTMQLVDAWVRTYGIQVRIRESFKNWRLQYQGQGADMQPFEDGNPQASYDICPAKECPQLFEGAIWKCPPLAYLPMQNEKYRLSEKWAPYLAYEPLQPGCSDEELEAFFRKGVEPVCSMCPATPRIVDKPWPMPQKTPIRR